MSIWESQAGHEIAERIAIALEDIATGIKEKNKTEEQRNAVLLEIKEEIANLKEYL